MKPDALKRRAAEDTLAPDLEAGHPWVSPSEARAACRQAAAEDGEKDRLIAELRARIARLEAKR